MSELAELRGRRDEVRGLSMFARVSGDPTPPDAIDVVLVHGLVVSSAFVREAARHLGRYHRAWAPDLPGYGRSAKPARTFGIEEQGEILGEWLESVGLRRAALVGCSLGTQVATAVAARRPQLVERLVLLGPTMDRELRSWPKALRQWLKETPHEVGMTQIKLRDYARAGIGRAIETAQLAMADRMEDRLPLLNMPTLVVRGSRDHLVSQEWAEEVTRLLPRGRLVVLEGQPHALNFTSPALFADVVLEFLAEQAAVVGG
ncbi:MAG: alpha/beta hydrolase [Chloroflexota bacterium]|nr:alpha/beta hydrolase [Chloroflexota bacterium]